jgi:low temperature requirement protein LtrA
MNQGNSNDPLQHFDEYIEKHNKKGRKYDLIIILVILTISLYLNLGMKVNSLAIAYLSYRLIRYIWTIRTRKGSEN